jgi:GMP synthase-like glutamine amidotransferase
VLPILIFLLKIIPVMKPIRLHYLQHEPFEELGYIETWAKSHKFRVTSTNLFENQTLPAIGNFDWLVIMGGAMSVNDEGIRPWLKEEKNFIKSAIEAGKIVTGICLGSQLIAAALGSKVYPNKKKEIGWFPVSLTGEARENPLTGFLPETFVAMHWHGETFDLPDGAIHLMQTGICKNQAFIYRGKVLALQFHLEFTPESIHAIVEGCRGELVSGDFIQSEKDILQNTHLCKPANEYLAKMLDHFLAFFNEQP